LLLTAAQVAGFAAPALAEVTEKVFTIAEMQNLRGKITSAGGGGAHCITPDSRYSDGIAGQHGLGISSAQDDAPVCVPLPLALDEQQPGA
jgi:hypothetical protein